MLDVATPTEASLREKKREYYARFEKCRELSLLLQLQKWLYGALQNALENCAQVTPLPAFRLEEPSSRAPSQVPPPPSYLPLRVAVGPGAPLRPPRSLAQLVSPEPVLRLSVLAKRPLLDEKVDPPSLDARLEEIKDLQQSLTAAFSYLLQRNGQLIFLLQSEACEFKNILDAAERLTERVKRLLFK
jgi:hypothetical protein